jgi:hypothetical protein
VSLTVRPERLKSLSLIGELLMQSTVTFLALLRVVAGHDESTRAYGS